MQSATMISAVICGVAFMIGVAAKDDPDYNPSLNFRPNNVTLSILDYWVGSYYNGTTDVELSFYTGLASNWSHLCPNLVNTTVTKHYDSTVLALTEPSTYNVGYDPVNAFFTMWPNNFNFSTLPGPSWDGLKLDASLKFGLFSSDPTYQVDGKVINNFNWTLNATKGPPYSLSSTLTEYDPQGGWASNLASCNGSDIVEWTFYPNPYNINGNGFYLPDLVLDLQFDEKSANLSLNGYFIGYQAVKVGTETLSTGVLVVGKMKLSFLGVLDAYHSDVLANNTATPTWLRTVGFQNNSLNVGYTSTASSVSRERAVFATIIALTVMAGFV
ncbi:hypothetical protein AnigIFM60653_007443 [Aspergillus niger]|nr:hypothetical protein AnigIFM49718_003180 [Aspergillus niger]GKZ84887.1 hypothetical protein AnigIFM56816_010447 [Aspergillus niger]GLA06505.1 hypothetical protein AnigIFM60653_007443 [Aspergillus niger]GLA16417.1 hypothetical protein AnigIFM62618_002996 [Aspergillus niger]GLA35499.1 hypothetical protein AnigIFM63309_011339 [Aspergillus niger]